MTDPATPAVTAFATARGDAPWSADDERRPGPDPLDGLRPVGASAVLDGGFDLLRSHFRLLFVLAATLYVPIRILDLSAMVLRGDAAERIQAGPALLFAGDGPGWSWAVLILQSCALSVLGLCVGHLVAALLRGETVTYRELLGVVARRGWVAVAILPLSLLVRAPLSCIVVGFLFADALVFLSSVVAGAEGLGPVRAWRRAMQLSWSCLGLMVGVSLGGLVISQLLRLSFLFGPMLLAMSFGADELVVNLIAEAGAFVVLVAEPLTACFAARAYLEVRCRSEGLDLRRRTRERFPTVVAA